jgi:hypothetical protein
MTEPNRSTFGFLGAASALHHPIQSRWRSLLVPIAADFRQYGMDLESAYRLDSPANIVVTASCRRVP